MYWLNFSIHNPAGRILCERHKDRSSRSGSPIHLPLWTYKAGGNIMVRESEELHIVFDYVGIRKKSIVLMPNCLLVNCPVPNCPVIQGSGVPFLLCIIFLLVYNCIQMCPAGKKLSLRSCVEDEAGNRASSGSFSLTLSLSPQAVTCPVAPLLFSTVTNCNKLGQMRLLEMPKKGKLAPN